MPGRLQRRIRESLYYCSSFLVNLFPKNILIFVLSEPYHCSLVYVMNRKCTYYAFILFQIICNEDVQKTSLKYCASFKDHDKSLVSFEKSSGCLTDFHVGIMLSGVGYRELQLRGLYSDNLRLAKSIFLQRGIKSLTTVLALFSDYVHPNGSSECQTLDLPVDKMIVLDLYHSGGPSDTRNYRYFNMFRAVHAGLAYLKTQKVQYVLRSRVDIQIRALDLPQTQTPRSATDI